MNICVLSTSMRPDSQSRKVSDYLAERLRRQDQNGWVLDLYEKQLPNFDDGHTSGGDMLQDVLSQLESADGFVFVSPEWDGMMSYGLHHLFHWVGHELAHKPVMLVGVSGGRGGWYPIAQMRMMGPKNKHFVISPENLAIQQAADMLNNHDTDESAADYSLKQRADYALKTLLLYAEALRPIRDNPHIDFKRFGSGV